MLETILIPTIDYTSRDFETIRARLIVYAKSQIPDWNDFLESNWGTVLIEMIAYVGDMTAFYLDRSANESFIDRCQSSKNMLSLSKLIGYTPQGSLAATVTVQVILSQANPDDIIISRGRLFTTEDCHSFELQRDITIRAGSLVGEGLAKDSVSRSTELVSTGMAGQTFVLPVEKFVDDGSMRIIIEGTVWKRVFDFVDSNQFSKHYVVVPNELGFGVIQFGDSLNGFIPTPGTLISISYQTGGGITGNVATGSVNNVIGPILDVRGSQVSIALIMNPDPATGGRDPESVDETRFKAPRSLRTLLRTVSRDDFINNVGEIGGVLRAAALSSDDTTTIPENSVVVFIVPIGGGEAPTELLDVVTLYIESTQPTTITLDLMIVSAHYQDIDIDATVALHAGFEESEVRKEVIIQLNAFFNLAGVDDNNEFSRNLGEVVYFSELVSVMFRVRGVRNVIFTTPSDDVSISFNKFAVLGSINLTFLQA